MSAATEDYAAKGINLFLAVVAAGVYDDADSTWTGPIIPESPTAFTLTYDTAADTVPIATVASVSTTGSSVGAASGANVYAYTTQAQADAIPVNINALAADVLALKKVLVAVINTLVAASLAT